MAETQEQEQGQERREPWRGEVWRHVEQDPQEDGYAIVGRATCKGGPAQGYEDGEPDGLVVYRRLYEGAYYVRSLENFLSRFVYVRGPSARLAADRDVPFGVVGRDHFGRNDG